MADFPASDLALGGTDAGFLVADFLLAGFLAASLVALADDDFLLAVGFFTDFEALSAADLTVPDAAFFRPLEAVAKPSTGVLTAFRFLAGDQAAAAFRGPTDAAMTTGGMLGNFFTWDLTPIRVKRPTNLSLSHANLHA